MDNREIIHELNTINKTAESEILRQILSSLMIGFFVGIPDNVYDKIFDLHLNIKSFQEKVQVDNFEIRKYQESINQLDNIFNKVSNEKSKLIIGVLVLSMAYKKLENLRNILAHLNQHIQTLDFRNDISSKGQTLH